MTAPAYSSRVTPSVPKMNDGYRALVSFAADPDVGFYEKGIKPPGYDGGDEIPTTTMHNTTWRTFAPRQLKTLSPATGTAAYAPDSLADILALININQAITFHYPSGDAMSAYGYLKLFEPQELQEGQQPEAQFTIVWTNTDPSTGATEGPAYHNNPGT